MTTMTESSTYMYAKTQGYSLALHASVMLTIRLTLTRFFDKWHPNWASGTRAKYSNPQNVFLFLVAFCPAHGANP